MKRLVILAVFSAFVASCLPTAAEQQQRNGVAEKSFRCMWAGDCS